MRPRKIEKVQLILPPPRRPDTHIIKFARWPQPLGILSIGAYLGVNNPAVNVEILDGNNILTLDEVIDKLDADVVGITATGASYEYAIKVGEIASERGASVGRVNKK